MVLLKVKARFAASFHILHWTRRWGMIISGLWLLLLKHDTSASFQPSLHQLLRYRRAERAFQLSCLCIIKADTILQYNAQTYYSTSLLSDSLLIIEFVILKVRSCPCRIKAPLSSQHRYSLKDKLLWNSSLFHGISLLKYCSVHILQGEVQGRVFSSA